MPEVVTGDELDRGLRRELSSLGQFMSVIVARHLVMVAELLDDDPELAWQHAQAAVRRAGRIGAVREVAGVAAYRAGEYAEALRELRAARRLTGSDDHLPMIADCERGLGRPERALEIAASTAAATLAPTEQVEMLIVAAGARIDLGQAAAAVAQLQIGELTKAGRTPLRDRLRAAYALALEAAGREREAEQWWERAGLAPGGADDGTGVDGAAMAAGAGVGDDPGEDEFADEIIDLLEETGPVVEGERS